MHPDGKKPQLGEGTIYINDQEFTGVGLTSYDYREYADDVEEYFKTHAKLSLNTPGEISFSVKIKRILLLKLMGIWDWILENCPNGRVKHLIKYGKKERVRYKNFKRAVKLLSKNVKENDQ